MRILTAARESAHADLLRDSGADAVVVSSEAAERLLSLSASQPSTATVLDALITRDGRLTLTERDVQPREVGRAAQDLDAPVVAVLRGNVTLSRSDARVAALEPGDRLIVLRSQEP